MADITKIEDLPESTKINDRDFFVKQDPTNTTDTNKINAANVSSYIYSKISTQQDGIFSTDASLIAQNKSDPEAMKITAEKLYKYLLKFLTLNAKQKTSVIDGLNFIGMNPANKEFTKCGVKEGVAGLDGETWEIGTKNAAVAHQIARPSDPMHIMRLLSIMPAPVLNKTFFEVYPEKVKDNKSNRYTVTAP